MHLVWGRKKELGPLPLSSFLQDFTLLDFTACLESGLDREIGSMKRISDFDSSFGPSIHPVQTNQFQPVWDRRFTYGKEASLFPWPYVYRVTRPTRLGMKDPYMTLLSESWDIQVKIGKVAISMSLSIN